MKKLFSTLFAVWMIFLVNAQELTMYPTHWFAGMNRDRVQLILKSDDSQFSRSNVRVQYPGVSLVRTHRFSNGKYLVLDVSISKSAQPGSVSIITTTNKQSKTYTWALKKEEMVEAQSLHKELLQRI